MTKKVSKKSKPKPKPKANVKKTSEYRKIECTEDHIESAILTHFRALGIIDDDENVTLVTMGNASGRIAFGHPGFSLYIKDIEE